MGGHPLQNDLAATLRQSSQCPPDVDAQLWADGPSRTEARADWESVHTTMGSSVCAGFSRRWLRAEWRASISARKLEQMLPAGVRTSSSPPSGHSMSAPAPPFVTPSVADPSVHTQVAHCGRAARCWEAASLRCSSLAAGGRAAPMSSLMVTGGTGSHGGSGWTRMGSIGGLMSAALQTSSPTRLQPVTARRRVGASLSATSRSGSSSGRARALASRRAARARRRSATGARPASAITACEGVDRGQPVTTLAAARISLSSSTMWDGDVAGSHAAAACSRAPRM